MPYYAYLYSGYGDFLGRNLYVLLLLPVLLLSAWARYVVNRDFKRYSKYATSRHLTGAQAAQAVLHSHGIFDVAIGRIDGYLTDRYHPGENTIYLSDDVYGADTISAVCVAAHEAGHAVQYAVGYTPARIRMAIVPMTQIGSRLSLVLFFIGMLLYYSPLLFGAVILFSFTTLFQLVTLPVEFDASARAIETLDSMELLEDFELEGAKKVLRSAALTYVAALLMSMLQLFRFILIAMSHSNNGGNRRGGSR